MKCHTPIYSCGICFCYLFWPYHATTTTNGKPNLPRSSLNKCNYNWLHHLISQLYFSIDATIDDGRTGRYINHSKSALNLLPKVIEAPDGQPHIAFFAARNISAEQEVLYDYGERNPQIIQSHPWLRK